MKKKTDFDWLINIAIAHPVETIIVSIILTIILLIVFRHFHIKKRIFTWSMEDSKKKE